MRKSRFSEEQIVKILKLHENGLKVAELCRQHGISEQTQYRWKSKYGGMEVSEVKCLKELEAENRKLKPILETVTIQAHGDKQKDFKISSI